MLNRIINTFKDAGANAFFREAQEAADAAKKHIEQTTAKTKEYMEMEVSGLVSLSKSHKPEQVMEVLAQSIKSRQDFLTNRTKEMLNELSEAGPKMVNPFDHLSKEISAHTATLTDSAFTSAKQGLSLAEYMAKSLMSSESKNQKTH